jgi:oxygen-independent coproporphyrinogen-3 oxidase
VAFEIERFESLGWERRPLGTLFFGGGTPSLFAPGELETILSRADGTFGFLPGAEITLEINPENVTDGNARAWRSLGINRASLGVQSLDDAELARLKRTHRSSDSRQAFDLLRSAGFTNVSVDLIFGLEGQTPAGWESTLRGVAAWNPEHLSAYSLTIEEKTLFAVEQRQGKLRTPTEEDQATMFSQTRDLLSQAGLPPYEISNFAGKGFESRHNLTYWTGGDYRGVGVSAHSFRRSERIERWWNLRNVPKYIETMEARGDPTEGREELSIDRHRSERLIIGLRLASGIDLKELSSDLGGEISADTRDALSRFIETGHIEKSGSRIRLTQKGALVSDTIFAELL